MRVLRKLRRTTMGSFGMKKYLAGGILTFIFGVCLVTQLAVTIVEHIRHNSAVTNGVSNALKQDMDDMTVSVHELLSIKYGTMKEGTVKCRSDVKYPVIILTQASSSEFRDNMRKMWRNFELIIDVETKNSSKMEHPRHQMFFLVHSLQYETKEVLRNVINESIVHQDIFYVENIYNITSLANETYDFSSVVRGLMFANAICKEMSHIIISTDTAFLHVRNAISLLDHKGLPWSVYGWFYSNIKDNDADTFIRMDMQSFIISSDLASAFLDNSMEELVKAGDPPTFLGQLLRLQARIIPDNNFLTGRLMFHEPLTTICDYVPKQIISRANLNMNDMRRVWFILREPFPHCNGALKRLSYWNYFKVREKEVWTYNKTILIENVKLCSSNPDLIIMIHSHAMDFHNRSITRNTWASPGLSMPWPIGNYTLKTKIVFVLGNIENNTLQTHIQQEAMQYRDILQGSFPERYQHLSMKHAFGFSWIAEHCDNAKYVLKADDDVIVNLPYLQTVLNVSPLRKAIVGSVRSCPWRAPVRNGVDKWGVPVETYVLNHYPVYVPGSSYVVTMDIVAELASISNKMIYLPFDDVYFTGILARTIGVNHVYWPQYRNRFANKPVDQPIRSIACNMLANHWIDTFFWGKNRALDVWKRLKTHKKLNCKWPEDLANSASKRDAVFESYAALTMEIFGLLFVATLIVFCKTAMC